jgi:hypothetical protein
LHPKGEKLKNYKESQVYTTSSLCSAAEEGMTASSPEVDGGTRFFTAEAGAAGTAEAAEGEIVVNNAGANFFALSKKAFISSRVWL